MIGAVVLAAGYSSRMGAFKPLLEVEGLPALVRVIRCLKTAGADEVAVVTGHNRDLALDCLAREGATEIYNAEYAGGMFASARAGVGYFAEKKAEGILLTPADYPLVPSAAVKKLLEAAKDNGAAFAVPTCGGAKGHPLWIHSRFYGEILAHDGALGLKGVTRRYEDEILLVETPFEGVLLDMDGPEDYEKILAFSASQLAELSSGRRFILLRHGETERHPDKIFMGKYDARLSGEGLSQAERAADEISKLEISAKAVYCGGLSRARTSAEIIAGRLKLPVSVHRGLDELSLGAWEGRPIEDIKRDFPAEYKKRGENILAFRLDGEAENFYDLQYRAADSLVSILSEDGSRDIIIASHSGVIKCLYGKLFGRNIDWAYPRCRPAKGEYLVLNFCEKR